MSSALEADEVSSRPIAAGWSALGQQAQHFRCQVASGLQQRFDGAARAFSECFPQQRYAVTSLTTRLRVRYTRSKQQLRLLPQVSGQAGIHPTW